MSADCVVDANVVIKLFLVEPSSEGADALFGHLADTPAACFYVPDLLYSECASVLWKYVRRFGYPLARSRTWPISSGCPSAWRPLPIWPRMP